MQVIYGDTDSIFLYTGQDSLAEAKAIAGVIKSKVNKTYRKMEIEIDGIFKSMLLLKKKKYAAMIIHEEAGGKITTHRETKGLDLVRRDWCQLSKDVGE